MKYQNLDALLRADPQARSYFHSLPDYVKDQISTRPGGISSFASMRDYAENLTRGDD